MSVKKATVLFDRYPSANVTVNESKTIATKVSGPLVWRYNVTCTQPSFINDTYTYRFRVVSSFSGKSIMFGWSSSQFSTTQQNVCTDVNKGRWLYIGPTVETASYPSGTGSVGERLKTAVIQTNDVVETSLNVEDKTISCMINGVDYGTVFRNVPYMLTVPSFLFRCDCSIELLSTDAPVEQRK